MKTLLTSFVGLLLLLIVHTGQAQAILRCNNVGVTGTGIFATLQAAHDAAASGDIIYLEPSSLSYGDLNCAKPLTIIGNGYLHAERTPLLAADPRPSLMSQVFFRLGSAGSRITGVTVTGLLLVNATNVVVERNRIGGSGLNIGADVFVTGANAVITSGIIRQNLVETDLSFRLQGTTTISNILVDNNIVLNNITGGNSTGLNGVLLSNNIVGNKAGTSGGGIDVDNCVLKNNIVTQAAATFAARSNAFSNNLGTGTQFGAASGNQQNVALAAIFGSATGSETQFEIAVGGPADNTGESGADCGAFGGGRPYILAGLPNVPTIFEYSQAVSGTTLNATISTRSNK